MIFPQSPKHAQVSFAHSHVPTLRRSHPAIGALDLQAQMNDFRCRMARNDVSHRPALPSACECLDYCGAGTAQDNVAA